MSDTATGKAYWRSLEELADTPEFRALAEREFPTLATSLCTPASRRQFLKIMGASAALAGLTACRWPKETIAPYVKRPAGRTPGMPVRYATAMEIGGVAQGLLVTSVDGRPIKVDGHPDHPANRGASDAVAQASILELYDPDRAAPARQRDDDSVGSTSWDGFAALAKEHFAALRARGGAGLAVLTEHSSSLSLADMRRRFHEAFPQAGWYVYEPLVDDHEREGTRLVFGSPYRPHYAIEAADVIVCLGADLLGRHPEAIAHTRGFATGRDVDEHGEQRDGSGPLNRLYVVECAYTITGGMADHRVAIPATALPAAACELARALLDEGLDLPEPLQPLAASIPAESSKRVLPPGLVRVMAEDLLTARGRAVIAAGPAQPPAVHALIHALNTALGHVGTAVTYTPDPEPERPTCVHALRTLKTDIVAGKVETLVMLGGNPAYDAPANLDFATLLESVPTTIHLGLFENETSRACTWRLPRAHYLESWGDARASDGTLSIVQPLIEPLYGGRTPVELLALLLGEEKTSGFDIVRRALQQAHNGANFETFWRRALHDGLVVDTAYPRVTPTPQVMRQLEQELAEVATWTAPPNQGEIEVVFTPDNRVLDGRFANNGWLQEMPDPLTKLTWDNAALIAPTTAARLGVESGDVLALEHAGRRIEIPAFVQPGQAPGSLAVALGYGRTAAGHVGDGLGCDAYRLRTTESLYVATGVRVSKLGRRHVLATTQDHQAIDSAVGRREKNARVGMLVREADVDEYTHHPEFARHAVHHPPLVSLWQEPEFMNKSRWGMAIDLNRCTGCGACIVACQAENNIPVVGKDEVRRGREMHWLRIDRYYRGAPDEAQVVHQPLACHHCENAPCEQVCPVAATVHSKEGLNEMVYNRCVGTRYCSNNCPYKARRFNWFNNWKDLTKVEEMAFNPEVTVRSRGVMEKCTFCVQRISAARIAANSEQRPIADGEIIPACAQACPAEAIVFGNLSDPTSRVSELHERDRAYALLAELNVKPRTKYLAKLRNPAVGRPAGDSVGQTHERHDDTGH